MSREPYSPEEARKRNRPTRINVDLAATLKASDGHETAVRVLDLSGAGFRIRLDDDLIVGEQVELIIDHDCARAEIRWVQGNEAGGLFLDPARLAEG